MSWLGNILQGSLNIVGDISPLARSIHNDFRGLVDYTAQTISGAKPSSPILMGFTPPQITVDFVPFERTVRGFQFQDLPPPENAAGRAGSRRDATKLVESYSDEFWADFKGVAARTRMNPEDLLAVLLGESGLDPRARSPGGEAYGLNQITQVAADDLKMSRAEYDNYKQLDARSQLAYVERYFSNQVRRGARFPNATAVYIANFAPAYNKFANDPSKILYDGRGPRKPNGGPTTKSQEAYDANRNLDRSQKGFITVGDMAIYANAAKSSAAYAAGVKRLKAVGVSVVPPQPAQIGGTGLNFTVNVMNPGVADAESRDGLRFMGRNLSAANKIRQEEIAKLVARINRQIRIMQDTPSLLMLINPSNFVVNYGQNINLEMGRRGPIVSQWLENPIKISASGMTSAFYSVRNGAPGLSAEERMSSISYLNLMSIVGLYLNNGVIYNTDEHNEGIPVFSAGLYLYYDGCLYLGSFDSMNIRDAAEKPFSLSYSFVFNARYKYKVGALI